MCQMVCVTEPSGKSSLETVQKRQALQKVLGDWMNHMLITVYHGLTSIVEYRNHQRSLLVKLISDGAKTSFHLSFVLCASLNEVIPSTLLRKLMLQQLR